MAEEYTRERRTDDLISMLAALQQPDCNHKEIKRDLEGVYFDSATGDGTKQKEPYRHSYGAISSFLYSVCFDGKVFDSEPLSCMIENLETIIKDIPPEENLYKPLMKLADHLSLELTRFSQQADVYNKLQNMSDSYEQLDQLIGRCEGIVDSLAESEERAQQTQEKLDEQEAQIALQQTTYQKLQEKLNKQQEELTAQQETITQQQESIKKALNDTANANTQSITVLSIFAGMSFIFTGGLSMLSSAFTSLQSIDEHKSLLMMAMVVLLSMVLVDVVWLLIRAARKYMSCNDKLPCSFWVFTGLMCIVALLLFGLYLFDPLQFAHAAGNRMRTR